MLKDRDSVFPGAGVISAARRIKPKSVPSDPGDLSEFQSIWDWISKGGVMSWSNNKLTVNKLTNLWHSAFSRSPLVSPSYWEISANSSSTMQMILGVGGTSLFSSPLNVSGYGVRLATGQKASGGNVSQTYTAAVANGATVGLAFDPSTRKLFASVNGVWIGNPVEKTGEMFVLPDVSTFGSYHPAIDMGDNGQSIRLSSRAADLLYPPPSGYKTLAENNFKIGISHGPGITLSEDSARVTTNPSASSAYTTCVLSRSFSTQRVYVEFDSVIQTGEGNMFGVSDWYTPSSVHPGNPNVTQYAMYHYASVHPRALILANGGSWNASGTYSQGVNIGVLYDGNTGQVTFYRNGVSQGSPPINLSLPSNQAYHFCFSLPRSSSIRARTSRTSLVYALPSGAIPLDEVAA